MNQLTTDEKKLLNNLSQVRDPDFKLGDKLFEVIGLVGPAVNGGTPVNAVAAAKTLTISGVVKDSEKVTIGADVYEFLADVALTKTSPANIAVDINAETTKALGTLTMDTQPISGNTVTIGTKVYTFVPVGTANADGEVSIGADLAAAKVNLVAAINGTDGFNIANTVASAADFIVNDCIITALIGGTAGNSIATTETFTAETNVFAAATLTTGADCTAANAVIELVAAITANDTQGVGAADGDGDTVVLTADVAGVAGNSIAIAETLVNGAFAGGAIALSGGVNGTVALTSTLLMDASYLYLCLTSNTIIQSNWRRIALGSAY